MVLRYWCHGCCTEITATNHIEACIICGHDFIEEIVEGEPHPQGNYEMLTEHNP